MLRSRIVAAALALPLAVATGAPVHAASTTGLPARPTDEGGFVVDYLTPRGQRRSAETDAARAREWRRCSRRRPRVAAYLAADGRRSWGCSRPRMNTGDILVRLKPRGERSRPRRRRSSSRHARRSCTRRRRRLAEIELIQVLQDMLGDLEGNPEPIEIKIFGDDTGHAR